MPRIPSIHGFGGMLTVLTVLLGIFSWWVDSSGKAEHIWILFLLWASMSLVYTGASLSVFGKQWPVTARQVFFWAMLMRLALLYSQPILETDFYRYLWDGYVTLQGVNPYRYSPSKVLHSIESTQPSSDGELERLCASVLQDNKAEAILRQVNHPEYPSIYPPFAQSVFAVSALVFPHSLHGWRFLMLLFDTALIVVLARLLEEWNLDKSRVIAYAWSPLVLKEYINTAHLDIAMLACLLAALWSLKRGWKVRGGVLFAAAVLCKWFPLILLPLWAKKMGWKGAVAFVLGFVLITTPFYLNPHISWQGTAGYSLYWESNSSFVMVVERLLDALGFPGIKMEQPGFFTSGIEINSFLLAKLICSLIAVGAMVWFTWKINRKRYIDEKEWYYNFLLIGIVLLCSPVVNPWYVAWIVPFLCLYPSKAWLYLSCACLAYYSVFMSQPYGYPFWLQIFEYGPFVVLAGMEWRQGRVEIEGK